MTNDSTDAGPAKIYGVVLSVGLVCALAIVTVDEITKPIIRNNRIAMRQRAILEVLPGASTSKAFQIDETTGELKPEPTDSEAAGLVFAGYDDNDELIGLAIETQGMGYADIIRILYGYSFDKQAVIGTSVLESRETPGLGDQIEKNANFLANFESLDVSLNAEKSEVANPIEFVKPGEKTEAWQIDGITGATISSRAITKMLSESTGRWIPKLHPHQADFATREKEAP
ncbi:Electron transport complex protein RnfG [Rubripirellula obstinata]|uniref:Ion-translocating oxidoreductase complex subunit G n=1 Tax=Rubripirellula obstinata TaxID=406547 RepID=A0A5B1CG74_9BACT|nr:FMN-binding protein [Rubripirellula obstinata]KAA1259182.1 Electron transport complex protein RnfG [Rubripirellula obstinata]